MRIEKKKRYYRKRLRNASEVSGSPNAGWRWIVSVFPNGKTNDGSVISIVYYASAMPRP